MSDERLLSETIYIFKLGFVINKVAQLERAFAPQTEGARIVAATDPSR